MAQLTVDEAAATYTSAMRNVPRTGWASGICSTCRTFIDPSYAQCFKCNEQASMLDVVVPISYSEHLGQLHHALCRYKDGVPAERRYAMPRLAAIIWKFLASHEPCIAAAAGAAGFDCVTTVPSGTPERDDQRSSLRTIVSWCQPIAARYERVARVSGDVPAGRDYDPRRYRATARLDGRDVLLVDDTWATGGHAQSCAAALRAAGASTVALVVIGRHLRRDWRPVPGGPTCGEIFDDLPGAFDWSTCAVHRTRSGT